VCRRGDIPRWNASTSPLDTAPATGTDLIAHLRETFDQTGELDWSIVDPALEIHDHQLLDSSVHRCGHG
jgi:hypothetical protein